MATVQLKDQNAVFFHIPKTAGFSISHALTNIPNHTTHPHRHLRRPVRAVQYVEEKIPSLWTDNFTFCFIRNPWDWTVSGWKHVTENKNCYTDPPTFDAFVKGQWRANLRASLTNWKQKYLQTEVGVAIHTQVTQWEHLTMSNGKLAPIQFFGRFENLEEDWRMLCKIIGVRVPLPHLNKSRRQDYR